jgi:hypothetical protein
MASVRSNKSRAADNFQLRFGVFDIKPIVAYAQTRNHMVNFDLIFIF